jgi:hypothetical protein
VAWGSRSVAEKLMCSLTVNVPISTSSYIHQHHTHKLMHLQQLFKYMFKLGQ